MTDMKWLLVVSAILTSLPGSVVTQTPPNHPRPRTLVPTSGPHGRIGVVVKTGAAPGTDQHRCVGLKPSRQVGPRQKPVSRPVTSSSNSTARRWPACRRPEENASGPGRKLRDPGARVGARRHGPIEYRRGGDVKKTKIITEDVGSWMVIVDPVEPMGPGMVPGARG